jgi:hypothetical protein
VGSNEVLHDRVSFDVTPHTCLDVGIAAREPLVLAQVFGPRRHEKCFDEDLGVLEIAKHTPRCGTIPASCSAVCLHRSNKGILMMRSNVIPHSD